MEEVAGPDPDLLEDGLDALEEHDDAMTGDRVLELIERRHGGMLAEDAEG